MKKSGAACTFLACVLSVIALTANARDVVTDNPDQLVPQNSDHAQVTSRALRTDRNSQRVTVPGTLDIVFVVSNALLGFLLLRKLNNS
jgi:hypothetical protein